MEANEDWCFFPKKGQLKFSDPLLDEYCLNTISVSNLSGLAFLAIQTKIITLKTSEIANFIQTGESESVSELEIGFQISHLALNSLETRLAIAGAQYMKVLEISSIMAGNSEGETVKLKSPVKYIDWVQDKLGILYQDTFFELYKENKQIFELEKVSCFTEFPEGLYIWKENHIEEIKNETLNPENSIIIENFIAIGMKHLEKDKIFIYGVNIEDSSVEIYICELQDRVIERLYDPDFVAFTPLDTLGNIVEKNLNAFICYIPTRNTVLFSSTAAPAIDVCYLHDQYETVLWDDRSKDRCKLPWENQKEHLVRGFALVTTFEPEQKEVMFPLVDSEVRIESPPLLLFYGSDGFLYLYEFVDLRKIYEEDSLLTVASERGEERKEELKKGGLEIIEEEKNENREFEMKIGAEENKKPFEVNIENTSETMSGFPPLKLSLEDKKPETPSSNFPIPKFQIGKSFDFLSGKKPEIETSNPLKTPEKSEDKTPVFQSSLPAGLSFPSTFEIPKQEQNSGPTFHRPPSTQSTFLPPTTTLFSSISQSTVPSTPSISSSAPFSSIIKPPPSTTAPIPSFTSTPATTLTGPISTTTSIIKPSSTIPIPSFTSTSIPTTGPFNTTASVLKSPISTTPPNSVSPLINPETTTSSIPKPVEPVKSDPRERQEQNILGHIQNIKEGMESDLKFVSEEIQVMKKKYTETTELAEKAFEKLEDMKLEIIDLQPNMKILIKDHLENFEMSLHLEKAFEQIKSENETKEGNIDPRLEKRVLEIEKQMKTLDEVLLGVQNITLMMRDQCGKLGLNTQEGVRPNKFRVTRGYIPKEQKPEISISEQQGIDLINERFNTIKSLLQELELEILMKKQAMKPKQQTKFSFYEIDDIDLEETENKTKSHILDSYIDPQENMLFFKNLIKFHKVSYRGEQKESLESKKKYPLLHEAEKFSTPQISISKPDLPTASWSVREDKSEIQNISDLSIKIGEKQVEEKKTDSFEPKPAEVSGNGNIELKERTISFAPDPRNLVGESEEEKKNGENSGILGSLELKEDGNETGVSQSLGGAPQTTQPILGFPQTTQSISGFPQTTKPISGFPQTTQSISGFPQTTKPISGFPQTTQPISGFPQTTQSISGFPQTTQPISGFPQTTQPISGFPQTTKPISGFPQTTQSISGFPQTTKPISGFPQTTNPTSGFPQTTKPTSGFPQTTKPISGFPQSTQPGFPQTTQSGFSQTTRPISGFPQTTQSGFSQTSQQPGFPQTSKPISGFPSTSQARFPQTGQTRPGFPQTTGGFTQNSRNFPTTGFPQTTQPTGFPRTYSTTTGFPQPTSQFSSNFPSSRPTQQKITNFTTNFPNQTNIQQSLPNSGFNQGFPQSGFNESGFPNPSFPQNSSNTSYETPAQSTFFSQNELGGQSMASLASEPSESTFPQSANPFSQTTFNTPQLSQIPTSRPFGGTGPVSFTSMRKETNMIESEQSKEGSLESFENSISRKSPSESSLNSTKRRRSKKFISHIPVLDMKELNPETYDLEKLISSTVVSCSTPILKSTPAILKACTISKFESPRYLVHKSRKSEDLFSDASQNRTKERVEERLERYLRSSILKVEDEQKQKEEDELASCSFKPSINSDLKLERRRSLEEFYLDQVKHKKNLEKKLEEERKERKKKLEEEEAKELKSKPEINEKSKKIVGARTYSPLPCHERLFKMHKSAGQHEILVNCLQKELEETFSEENCETQNFTPRVNKRSKELIRKTPIEIRLYEDAKRRMKKTKELLGPNKFLTSNHSIDILSNKILKEFEEVVCKLDLNSTGSLNYLKFRHLFEKMRFVDIYNPNKNLELGLILEIWHHLQENNEVAINDIKVSIMGLMGYFQSWMISPSQKFQLTKTETILYHEKYKLLFENRLLAKSKNLLQTESTVKSRKTLFKNRRTEDKITIQEPEVNLYEETHTELSESLSIFSENSHRVNSLPPTPSLINRPTMSLSDQKLEVFTTLRNTPVFDFSEPKTTTFFNPL